jgi:hypothetical protein
MELNFKLSEFNISGEPIPENVADKILHHHILPMQPVRDELGIKIYPSLKSAYRSMSWEEDHGRSGTSQHTFKKRGKGATDWTCFSFRTNKKRLLEAIIKHTDYTRICVYSGFIHCDYKKTKDNKRQLFRYSYNKVKEIWKWKFIKFI